MIFGRDPIPFDLDEQIEYVTGELRRREEKLPGLVSQGRISQKYARREIDMMRRIKDTLEKVRFYGTEKEIPQRGMVAENKYQPDAADQRGGKTEE